MKLTNQIASVPGDETGVLQAVRVAGAARRIPADERYRPPDDAEVRTKSP